MYYVCHLPFLVCMIQFVDMKWKRQMSPPLLHKHRIRNSVLGNAQWCPLEEMKLSGQHTTLPRHSAQVPDHEHGLARSFMVRNKISMIAHPGHTSVSANMLHDYVVQNCQLSWDPVPATEMEKVRRLWMMHNIKTVDCEGSELSTNVIRRALI